MTDQGRLKREDAERTDANRSSTKLFDQGGPNASSAVAYGARLGYQVIEEQIKQGQKIAEQISKTTSSSEPRTAKDLPIMIERMGRFYTDMLSTYVEMMSSYVEMLGPVLGPVADNLGRHEQTNKRNTKTSIELTAQALQPVRVSVQLDVECEEIQVGPLVNLNGKTIQGVTLEAQAERLVVNVNLPSMIDVDTYHGVLVNQADGTVVGTVTCIVEA